MTCVHCNIAYVTECCQCEEPTIMFFNTTAAIVQRYVLFNVVRKSDLFALCLSLGGDCAKEHSHDWTHRMWQDRDCEAARQISRRSFCQGNNAIMIMIT